MYNIKDALHGCRILPTTLCFQLLLERLGQIGFGVARPFQASHRVSGMANGWQGRSGLEDRPPPELAIEFVGRNIDYTCDEILVQVHIDRRPSLRPKMLRGSRNQGSGSRGGDACAAGPAALGANRCDLIAFDAPFPAEELAAIHRESRRLWHGHTDRSRSRS